jgi:hypothetical protein
VAAGVRCCAGRLFLLGGVELSAAVRGPGRRCPLARHDSKRANQRKSKAGRIVPRTNLGRASDPAAQGTYHLVLLDPPGRWTICGTARQGHPRLPAAPPTTTRAPTIKPTGRSTSWRVVELCIRSLPSSPPYYVMELDKNMAETVAPHMPSAARSRLCRWLTEASSASTARNKHQDRLPGRLELDRVRTSGKFDSESEVFSGRTIDVPSASSGKERLGRLPGYPVPSRRCRNVPARACWAAIWWWGPDTGAAGAA